MLQLDLLIEGRVDVLECIPQEDYCLIGIFQSYFQ